MWGVYEYHHLSKILPKLPESVLKHYEKWKEIVKASGPHGLQDFNGFHDEELHGKEEIHRSSRLNKQYRVIYHVDPRKTSVFVVNLTAHHYQKK